MENSTTATIFQHVSTLLSTTTEYTSVIPNETIQPVGIRFSWYDYAIFCSLLSVSLSISIYFGCCGKKQNAKDYLLAGGNMKLFPVVVSSVASHISGITLLALPAEIYSFGANYWLTAICLWTVSIITSYVYLPVFYKLQLTSTYEYLDIRFDNKTRKLASVFFTITVFLYTPIVTYVPSLAFSAASGLDIHFVIPMICGFCILYTSIGGLKALVWSDTLQFSLTMGALSSILILAIYKVGGIANVFKTSYENHRLDLFDFALDLTKRDSFWTIVIGYSVHWISQVSVNQGCMQKFLAVGSFRESKLVVFLYCSVGMVLVKSISVVSGLTMYTKYAKCDPLRSHQIRHNNELFPYFVLDVGKNIPGLPGLFIAGVFCASLSSLAGNLNSLAGTIYEDFVKSKLSEKRQQYPAVYLKSLVVIIGIIGTVLVYLVEYLGGLLSLSISFSGIVQGPLMGMFSLGILFPRATAKGAFYGGVVSSICTMTLVFGSYYLKSQHIIVTEYKPTSIEGCFNVTNLNMSRFLSNATTTVEDHTPSGLTIFKISFYWYALIGATICIIVGLIISYLSEEQDPPVARELLSPVIYGIIDNKKYVDKMDLDYDQINMDPDGKITDRRMSKWEENRQERLRKASHISADLDF